MAKSMSVQFADGTSHTYDDVPDDVTQEQVNARASSDYPEKKISAMGEGAHPEAPKLETPPAAPAPAGGSNDLFPTPQFPQFQPEKIVAGAQTGAQLLGEAATSPIGIAAETLYGGKKLLVDPLVEALKAKAGVPAGPAQPSMLQKAGEIVKQLGPNVARSGAPGGFQPVNPVGPQLPTAGTPEATMQGLKGGPIAGGAPAQEATTFIDRIASLASKYAPVARAATGAGLALYSPGLNTGEDEQLRRMRAEQDRQRAQGLIR